MTAVRSYPSSGSSPAACPALQLLLARRVFWIGLSVVVTGSMLASAWEYVALGWHPAREEPAFFSAYHFLRMAASALAGVMLGWLLARCREGGESMPVAMCRRDILRGMLALAVALFLVIVFLASPTAFQRLASEDHVVEWSSALLPFAGSVLFISVFGRQWRVARPTDSLLSLCFALLYFLIAMEEISWMQRVFNFDTPQAVSSVNWQGELNLHNIQTDISELAYYLGTGLFLILLPLAGEAIPSWKPLARFCTLVPGRATVAAAAPMVLFTYGHWNLLPIQILSFASLAALLVFAWTARTGAERVLFVVVSCAILIGQVLFLSFGTRMINVFDATEFKELFISIGLASFAFDYWRQARG